MKELLWIALGPLQFPNIRAPYLKDPSLTLRVTGGGSRMTRVFERPFVNVQGDRGVA